MGSSPLIVIKGPFIPEENFVCIFFSSSFVRGGFFGRQDQFNILNWSLYQMNLLLKRGWGRCTIKRMNAVFIYCSNTIMQISWFLNFIFLFVMGSLVDQCAQSLALIPTNKDKKGILIQHVSYVILRAVA